MPLTFASLLAKPLFEGLQGMFVLGMVAGPRGELDVAQLLQLAPHGGFVERDGKFVMKPLHQVDQPPANDAMDCRDRAALNDLRQRPPLGIVEDRWIARSLAVGQAIGAAGVEPDPQSRTI